MPGSNMQKYPTPHFPWSKFSYITRKKNSVTFFICFFLEKKKNGKNVKRAAIDGKGRAQQAGKQEPREGEYAVADGSRFPLSS